jgi:NAD(P)-dependent dehydrogenase (short-subunit alcohol dehydrogenase family)
MGGLCEGRVVVVTGAGGGIGRGHALEFARQGASVVVNDLGSGPDGVGGSIEPATGVVEEIQAQGGNAVANTDDVADWDGAGRLIRTAIDTFGRLDVLVNNAAVLRDHVLVSMSIEDWDTVIRVNLRGTFAPTRHALDHWRERSKAGDEVDGRIINTTSLSGLYANPAQANYGAAKAGIAAFTLIASREVSRYGVTANAVCPSGLTRLTGTLSGGRGMRSDDTAAFQPYDPENVAPIVVWLGSTQSRDVNGQIFRVRGGTISVMEGWTRGPHVHQNHRWDPVALGSVIPDLVARSERHAVVNDDRMFHEGLPA